MIQKNMSRVDTINQNKEHEEEARIYANITEQCEIKMRELYNRDIRKLPGWKV